MSPPLICQQHQGSVKTKLLKLSKKTFLFFIEKSKIVPESTMAAFGLFLSKKNSKCRRYCSCCRSLVILGKQKTGQQWRCVGLGHPPGFKHESLVNSTIKFTIKVHLFYNTSDDSCWHSLTIWQYHIYFRKTQEWEDKPHCSSHHYRFL